MTAATETRCDICNNKVTTKAQTVLGWITCGALGCRIDAIKRGQA